MKNLVNKFAALFKNVIYGTKGEPYTFNNITLRYLNNSRPIRFKYLNSANEVNRNEILQYQFLKNHLNKDSIFWDIGAHYGTFSLLAYCCINMKGRIYGFEPDEIAYSIAKNNVEINKLQEYIYLNAIPIFSEECDVTFDMQSGNSNSHLISDHSISIVGEKRILKSKTLNGLIKSFPKPTLIKIDTEGAELDIINGASELLKDHSIKFICEIHPFAWPWYKDVNWMDFVKRIESSGRIIQLIDSHKKVSDLPFYGTILF